MPITTYSELQTAVSNWMARSDVSGEAEDFISLAEAHLNREISAVETDATITGTTGSRSIDISSLSLKTPIALFLVDPSSSDEVMLTQKADGTFPYRDTAGEPRYWAIDGDNIDFDCPLDVAYSFRLRYSQKFALSDAAPTNWLLTNHPDVYLAATLIWGGVFVQDDTLAQRFNAVLDRGIAAVQSEIAQKKRGTLVMDPMLQQVGWRPFYDGVDP
ncbi:phage adaptor protein [Nitratireductor sp. CH_MIT9313-5]|uniref:phage adaptor protein n=1 Tax=Nitratireductor sp. CH_MIT9313-5 TaxID=3107764 RepID=UPI00300B7309